MKSFVKFFHFESKFIQLIDIFCGHELLHETEWFFLTTERSEVVPFFRAVRAEKRGRKATPSMGAKPPPLGREATSIFTGGLPSVRWFSLGKLP